MFDATARVLPLRLIEHSPALGMLLCDGAGRVVQCSPWAAEMYNSRVEEVEGLSVAVLLLKHGYTGFKPPPQWDLERLCGQAGRHRFEALTADGREVPVTVSISRIERNHVPYYLLKLRAFRSN